MKRWSHAHSLAAGGLLTLALAEREAWLLCLGCFLLGIILGRFWNLLHWTGEAIRAKVLRARAEKIRAKPEPVYFGRDEIPY